MPLLPRDVFTNLSQREGGGADITRRHERKSPEMEPDGRASRRLTRALGKSKLKNEAAESAGAWRPAQ